MASTIKILGQANPTNSVLTDIYTVPANTTCTISSITACNAGTVEGRFSVSVAVGGAASAPAQFIYSDQSLEDRSTFVATIGITLGPGDVLRVKASSGDFSFNVFGIEVA